MDNGNYDIEKIMCAMMYAVDDKFDDDTIAFRSIYLRSRSRSPLLLTWKKIK